jgi:hypothetical protein
MIRCKPKGIFSWDFYLEGEVHDAILNFKWLGEKGRITVDRTVFEIDKHGLLNAKWSLIHNGATVAVAQKSSAFTRTFELYVEDEPFLVRAKSAWGRSFVLEYAGNEIATMAPSHPFTRRATIDIVEPNIDFPTLAFAFWLVVLTWRRTASSSS